MRIRMRKERMKRGWSQLDVALRTGLTYNTISRLELQDHYPSDYTARKLEELFGIDIDELMEEIGDVDVHAFTPRVIQNIMRSKGVILDDVVNTGYICVKNARHILQGKTPPSETAIYAFAKALDLSYDEVERCFFPDRRMV